MRNRTLRRIGWLIVIVYLIVLVTVLASCGWQGSGTVVERKFTPSHTSYTTVGCPNGHKRCSKWHADHWQVRIKDANGGRHWVDVDQQEYQNLTVGSAFSNAAS